MKYVKAPALRSGNDISEPQGDLDSRAVVNQVNSTYATVTFKPDVERQKQLAHVLGTKEDEGLSGQFVVQYEVERPNNGGEVGKQQFMKNLWIVIIIAIMILDIVERWTFRTFLRARQ